MMLVIYYLFYFVAATISPIQRRKLSLAAHGSGYAPAFALRVSVVVACFGLLLPFFIKPEFRGDPSALALLSLICGLFGTISVSSQYWAQKHVEAGLTTLAGNVYTPVTIVLATFLLGEGLTLLQIMGAALLFTSIIVVSKKHYLGKLRFDRYFMAMILSGVSLGIALTAERALLDVTGFTFGTLLSWWAQVAGLGVAAFWFGMKTTYTSKEVLITGFLRFLQLLAWVLLVYSASNLSVVSAITTFKVVIIFIFSAIFLNERDDLLRKIIGSFVAVIGLFLMR